MAWLAVKFRPALAARHHLDDEGGDDEQKGQRGQLEYAADDQAQERYEQQRLPRHDGHPIEETPPHHDDAPADLAEGLADSHGPRGGIALAVRGGVVSAWIALVGIHLFPCPLVTCQ